MTGMYVLWPEHAILHFTIFIYLQLSIITIMILLCDDVVENAS